jgi:Domain of unknown function (DUF4389)
MSDTTQDPSIEPGPRMQPEPGTGKSLHPATKEVWKRGLYMLATAILLGLAQTALHVMSLVQFVVMLTAKGQPNEQIAKFGKTMGDWQAKAALFQTAQSEEKPWPWSPL